VNQVVLLSWQGTLLSTDAKGGLVQRPFIDLDEATVRLELPSLIGSFGHYLSGGDALEIPIAAGPLRGFTANLSVDRGAFSFARDGLFLSAELDLHISRDGKTAQGCEFFFPVRLVDLAHLRMILANDWLLREELTLIRRSEISIATGHRLRFGSRLLDLRDHLPFDDRTLPRRFTIYGEGWRIGHAYRYQPLVYFVAFGDPAILAQLRVAIETLSMFGHYEGPILLITDTSPAVLRDILGKFYPSRVMVRRIVPRDRTGFLAARYAILDFEEAALFQPILYSDTDIVFDVPIAPFLQAILCCDRISAPAEQFSLLTRDISVGAQLLAADGAETRYAVGFNSGTLGIPNLEDHGDTLRLIRRVLTNRCDLFGRRNRGFIDQPVANYVAFSNTAVDTGVLTPFVRYAWAGDEPDAAERRGLVHFFPPRSAQAKHAAMERYQARLLAVEGVS
jgi:hypothetical protein